MKILAIETSCDETGIALVEAEKIGAQAFEFEVLDAALHSQAALHAEYGGVYPNLAKREHEKNLPILYRQFANEKVNAIAVTHGPGLEPALWTGIEFAKRVAREQKLPLIPTNHLEGHLLSSLVSFDGPPANAGRHGTLENVSLPVLALLISGGHSEFVVMKDWLEYELVGQTLDDAVGECFDKVARMLGLPYPGGPEISKLANLARASETENSPRASGGNSGFEHPLDDLQREKAIPAAKLPRPMIQTKDCDMSFSGLKTAALYALRDLGGLEKLSDDERAAFAREFEDAVTDVLVAKTRRAIEQTGAQTFVIGGGVAANTHIRQSLQALIEKEFPDVAIRLPILSITGDNAVMIAIAALVRELSLAPVTPDPEGIRAHGRLSISAVK